MVDAPVNKLSGYDHRVISEFYKQRIDAFDPSDYPVLFWLSRLLPGAQYVFELGGSVGVGYYGYRHYIPFPANLRWVICEVPETVRVGQEIAHERNECQLTFTHERQVPGVPDIYVSFGALQYIEESFAEIIGNLELKPVHLLINRVPLSDGDSFVTLQNNGCWFSPYKVDNRAHFIGGMESLNYELVDKWEMNRPNTFLLQPDANPPKYYGMYFRLK